jgi:hypothetical protein
VLKYGKRLEELSVPERHEMRKAMKKMRYGIEFFGSLYPKDAVKPFLKRMKKLQDIFGYLNDVAMAETLPEMSNVTGKNALTPPDKPSASSSAGTRPRARPCGSTPRAIGMRPRMYRSSGRKHHPQIGGRVPERVVYHICFASGLICKHQT